MNLSDIIDRIKDPTGRKARRRKLLRRIGLGLMLAPVAINMGLSKRLIGKHKKLLELVSKGNLDSTKDVDLYIAKHLADTGKVLPKYKWTDLKHITDDMLDFGKTRPGRTPSGPLPVLRSGQDAASLFASVTERDFAASGKKGLLAKLKHALYTRLGRHAIEQSGPHFNPKPGYIAITHGMNPKTLLHELGHAQDMLNGKLNIKDRMSLLDMLKALVKPEATKTFQQEARAWDNAGIAAGDAMREAALDTYRVGLRNSAISTTALTPASILGISMYSKNKDKRKKP